MLIKENALFVTLDIDWLSMVSVKNILSLDALENTTKIQMQQSQMYSLKITSSKMESDVQIVETQMFK